MGKLQGVGRSGLAVGIIQFTGYFLIGPGRLTLIFVLYGIHSYTSFGIALIYQTVSCLGNVGRD